MKRATKNNGYNVVSMVISIHALVKRATQCSCKSITLMIISIHALVKRATNKNHVRFL